MQEKPNTENIPLRVYKASAGSGKTFRLAVEYIKLLIKDPYSYRSILAVTFTNKATEEMKVRILSQLNGLAHGYEDSNDYLERITEELHVDESFVRKQAQTALRSLTHDYNAFRVETIDKFFQRILKNLARELDLTANLRVELNDKQVEEIAVDNLIESLEDKDKVLSWLMSYILDTINKGKGWNVIRQIKTFGEQLFKDTYKMHQKELHPLLENEQFFNEFKKQLEEIQDTHLAIMADFGNQFFEATAAFSPSDFKYKESGGIYSYFANLRDGKFNGAPTAKRVADCLERPENWAGDSPNRAAIIQLAQTQLMDLLKAAESNRRKSYRQYRSAQLTLRHLNELRLLGRIEKTIRDMNDESNRFLLSDTQGLLNAMIDKSDSPFIFERIGAPLRQIMIDEFQDTSTLQWRNFKILLSNCMSQNSGNLIVGDVKQSIYRWRSGDWRLLNGIEHEFGDDRRLIETTSLDTNYRSCRRIITFNNHFFTTAAAIEHDQLANISSSDADQLKSAYSDVCQSIPSNKGDEGYVHVELMPSQEYKDHILERIAETVKTLLRHGIASKHIAILARSNDEISDTAEYFQTHIPDIPIVSDEAYRLDSSLAINMVINAMRVLSNENDLLSKAYLAKTWNNDILRKRLNDDEILLATNMKDATTAFSEWLPSGFSTTADFNHLRSLPLSDLAERICQLFCLDQAEGQSPYLCHFFDIIAEHLKDYTSDLDRFLQLWDDKYHKETIHGENIDGIRILTIHKSKGLEYENVIMPFCDWPLEKTNTIWCHTNEEPYKALPILPVDYSFNSMENTTYENDSHLEHLQNMVDNLNMLYVGFTRARTRLYVFGVSQNPNSKKKKETSSRRSLLIENSLRKMASPKEGTFYLDDSQIQIQDDGHIFFDYGIAPELEKLSTEKEKKESQNLLLQPDRSEPFVMKSYPNAAHFRQSNSSHAFTSTDPQELLRASYINRGNLLHEIFSRLRSIEDIDNVLQEMTHEGILYDEISPKELQDMLATALSNKLVRSWFSGQWTLHNECGIITKEDGHPKVLRPDRVMTDGKRTIVVDFKFGRYEKEHENQVRRYMTLLHDMGYPQVEGYLWYVSFNKTQKVKPQ